MTKIVTMIITEEEEIIIIIGIAIIIEETIIEEEEAIIIAIGAKTDIMGASWRGRRSQRRPGGGCGQSRGVSGV